MAIEKGNLNGGYQIIDLTGLKLGDSTTYQNDNFSKEFKKIRESKNKVIRITGILEEETSGVYKLAKDVICQVASDGEGGISLLDVYGYNINIINDVDGKLIIGAVARVQTGTQLYNHVFVQLA